MPVPDSNAAAFSLAGRVALVTGASSGIGREIASSLAKSGAAMIPVARRLPELEATRNVTGQTLFVDGGFSAA